MTKRLTDSERAEHWAARHSGPRVRARNLRRLYGISTTEYDLMLSKQDGRCAICGTDRPGGSGAFHVDHNHDTGRVRGLLCTHCNVGIGMLKDSPDLLQRAADYLLVE